MVLLLLLQMGVQLLLLLAMMIVMIIQVIQVTQVCVLWLLLLLLNVVEPAVVMGRWSRPPATAITHWKVSGLAS